MEYKIKDLDNLNNSKTENNSKIEIEVEISANEFDEYFNQALLDFSKEVEIEGFRRGKAPAEIVRQKIGEEKIIIEASEKAIKESYLKIITESKIEPIARPEVEVLKLAKGNPFIFKLKVSVFPKFDLPDYKKIALKSKKQELKVEEKEVEEAVDWAKRSRAKFTIKQGQADNNDFVEIEYSIKGEEQKIADAFILGKGHLLPGFEEQIIGMKEGEEKKDIALESQGKKFAIDLKLKSVQSVEFPEANDEFARSLGKFKDLEDFRQKAREGLLEEKEHNESHRIRDEIIENIRKETLINIPDFLIKEEQKRMLEDMKANVLEKLKISFEEYLKKISKTEETLLDSFKEEAESRIKSFLILKSIEKKEDINPDEKEIEQGVSSFLANYPDIKTKLDLEELKSYIENGIRQEKVFKFLESLIK